MDPAVSASQARFVVPAVQHQLPAPGRYAGSTALYIAIAHGPADYVVAHAGVIAERYVQAGVAFAALGEAILPRGSQGPQVSGPSFLESVKTSSLAHHQAVSKLFSSKDASAFDCVVAAVLKPVLGRPSQHERKKGTDTQQASASIDPTEEASAAALLQHGLGWLLRDEVRPASCPASPPPFRFTSSSASASAPLFVPLPQRLLAQTHTGSVIGTESQGTEADGLWPGDIVLKVAGGHTAGCSPALLQAYVGLHATHSTQQRGTQSGGAGSGEQARGQQAQTAIKFRVARPVELRSSSKASAAHAKLPALQPHALQQATAPTTTTTRSTTSTRQQQSGTPARAASPRSPSSPTSSLPSRRSLSKGTLPETGAVVVERQRSSEKKKETEKEEEPQRERAASGSVGGGEGTGITSSNPPLAAAQAETQPGGGLRDGGQGQEQEQRQQAAVDSTLFPHRQPQAGVAAPLSDSPQPYSPPLPPAPPPPRAAPAPVAVAVAAPVAVPAVVMQKSLALLKRKTGTGGTPGRRASVGGSTRSKPLVSPPPAPYHHPGPASTETGRGKRGHSGSPLDSRSVDLASLPAASTRALALGEGLDARARVMARQRLAEERMRARSATVTPAGSRGRSRAQSLPGGVGPSVSPGSIYGSGIVFTSPSPASSSRPTTPAHSATARPSSSSSSSRSASRVGPGGATGSGTSRALLPHQRRPSTFALGVSPAVSTAPTAAGAAHPAHALVQAAQRPVKRSASAQPRVASSGAGRSSTGREGRRPSVGHTPAAGQGSNQKRPATATAAVRPGIGSGGRVGVSQVRRIGTTSVLRSSSVPPPAAAATRAVRQQPGTPVTRPSQPSQQQLQRGKTAVVARPGGAGRGPGVGAGGSVHPRSSPTPVASPVFGTSPASPLGAIRIPPGFRSPAQAAVGAAGGGTCSLAGTPRQGQVRQAPRVTIGTPHVPRANVNVYADLVSPPVTGGRGRARTPGGPAVPGALQALGLPGTGPPGYRASELQELEVIEAELAAQGY